MPQNQLVRNESLCGSKLLASGRGQNCFLWLFQKLNCTVCDVISVLILNEYRRPVHNCGVITFAKPINWAQFKKIKQLPKYRFTISQFHRTTPAEWRTRIFSFSACFLLYCVHGRALIGWCSFFLCLSWSRLQFEICKRIALATSGFVKNSFAV